MNTLKFVFSLASGTETLPLRIRLAVVAIALHRCTERPSAISILGIRNLCFKLPFSELTSSCQHRLMEKPRLELKFKQWCAAGSTCFAPNVYSRFAERRAGEACIPEVHESDFSPV
jgi:hypothetical protein